jgi:hypothetical protein
MQGFAQTDDVTVAKDTEAAAAEALFDAVDLNELGGQVAH